jgi:hypothetical protein
MVSACAEIEKSAAGIFFGSFRKFLNLYFNSKFQNFQVPKIAHIISTT